MRPEDRDGSPPAGAFEFPEEVEGGHIVGVDTRGKPVYFDENDQVAFDAVERDEAYEAGETRGEGPLEKIVDDIEDAIGWDTLFSDESDGTGDDDRAGNADGAGNDEGTGNGDDTRE